MTHEAGRGMTPIRLAALALLAVSSAACTPAVGLSKAASSPAAARGTPAKSVMVIPAAEALRAAPGERIELSAWGFTRSGAVRVWFGETPATEVEVVDGWRVTVVVPEGAGLVDVCVENTAGAWVMLEAFRYPAGNVVQHCWPEGAGVASVDAARRRIAEVRGLAPSGVRLAAK